MRNGWRWGRVVLGAALVVVGGCARAAATPPADGASAQPAPAGRNNETGATQTVRVTAKDASRFTTVAEFLQGRFAGLQVVPAGDGSYTLQIRGVTSINMSTEPLVVIDGMQVMPGGVSSALAGMTPSDIEEVQVLKDASSEAFYGIRGANGVIIIRTKRHPSD